MMKSRLFFVMLALLIGSCSTSNKAARLETDARRAQARACDQAVEDQSVYDRKRPSNIFNKIRAASREFSIQTAQYNVSSISELDRLADPVVFEIDLVSEALSSRPAELADCPETYKSRDYDRGVEVLKRSLSGIEQSFQSDYDAYRDYLQSEQFTNASESQSGNFHLRLQRAYCRNNSIVTVLRLTNISRTKIWRPVSSSCVSSEYDGETRFGSCYSSGFTLSDGYGNTYPLDEIRPYRISGASAGFSNAPLSSRDPGLSPGQSLLVSAVFNGRAISDAGFYELGLRAPMVPYRNSVTVEIPVTKLCELQEPG